MYKEKQCIAMLLAGGKGTRLGTLTKYRAKPAVPFGGKNRLIDYTLSNCINSGIDTIGVLTQYQAEELNHYIDDGHAWGFDKSGCCLRILEPDCQKNGPTQYLGTADAVYHNVGFIEQFKPEFVVILSGDHVYKMDYGKMLRFHMLKRADCTISSVNVPIDQASQFGILNVRNDFSIYEFEEKPVKPKSTLASMGIYIFTWKKLRHYLEHDNLRIDSSHDFGKDVLPALVHSGERVFAYPFSGYWRDVGTIESLWAANMDLLSPFSEIRRVDPGWLIYANNAADPPSFVSDVKNIKNSIIMSHCKISGDARSSVIFEGVKIDKDAVVRNSIIFSNTHIGRKARIQNAIISENVIIGEASVIGLASGRGPRGCGSITVIGDGLHIAGRTNITGTFYENQVRTALIV